MGVTLYVTLCFSLAAFEILFSFCHFNYEMSYTGLFVFLFLFLIVHIIVSFL